MIAEITHSWPVRYSRCSGRRSLLWGAHVSGVLVVTCCENELSISACRIHGRRRACPTTFRHWGNAFSDLHRCSTATGDVFSGEHTPLACWFSHPV